MLRIPSLVRPPDASGHEGKASCAPQACSSPEPLYRPPKRRAGRQLQTPEEAEIHGL